MNRTSPHKKLVVVKRSSIHGRGLFAARDIKKKTLIGLYKGEKTMRDGKYVLWVYDESDNQFGIRGKNSLRFANHSAKPNATFLGNELWAIKNIAEGDEITFDYGEDWR